MSSTGAGKARYEHISNETLMIWIHHFNTFAMYCYSTFSILTNVQKCFDDSIIRYTSISKEEIIMVKPCIFKSSRIIHLLIQADYSGNIMPSEVWKIGFGCMMWIPLKEKTNAENHVRYNPLIKEHPNLYKVFFPHKHSFRKLREYSA